MEEGGVRALTVGRAGCVGRADIDGVVEGVGRIGRWREDRTDGFRETCFRKEGEKEHYCPAWSCRHGALNGKGKRNEIDPTHAIPKRKKSAFHKSSGDTQPPTDLIHTNLHSPPLSHPPSIGTYPITSYPLSVTTVPHPTPTLRLLANMMLEIDMFPICQTGRQRPRVAYIKLSATLE